ncbi:MAG TPA: SMC family ATPase [Acidimicrobiales bacterium]|nr:SMC family ATPase [Acidimicrobiales bacterium]
MRPRRLEVEGFTAFRGPTVVDFTGADLFALVGPTGAGKTSIIDALTFALYGSVPRLDDRRAVAPVISQNLTEARVRLDFSVGDQSYTAVRVVRATKGGATTKEARLERGTEVLAGEAKEVTAAVEGLVGLGFDHFTKCVSLPQGQFAQFLHAEPRKRQDLLVRLLDLGLYERVAGGARQRGALARNRADVIAGQLERLAGATPEARATGAARLDELAALARQLAAERSRLDELVGRAAEEQGRADEATAHAGLLDGVRAPAGVDDLATALATGAAARRRCAELEDDATEAVAMAEAKLAGLPASAALEALRADHGRRMELAEALERGRVAEANAAADLATARDAEELARGERQTRADELDRLRVESRALALTSELAVGTPCPVCGQEVHALPASRGSPDLRRAERSLAEAESSLARATGAVKEAIAHEARVGEKLGRLRADLADVDARLAGAAEPEAVDDQLAVVAAAEADLAKARQAVRDARAAGREVGCRHDELLARERDARRAFDAARDAVAVLEPPAAERCDLAADWAELVAWVAARRPAALELADRHRRLADVARAEAASLVDEAVGLCRDLGVDVPGDGPPRRRGAPTAWPGEAAAAAHARADADLRRVDADIAEAEQLRSGRGRVVEQQQVAEALAGHLAANRFEKWLLDEAVQQLAHGASRMLGELSGGAYALAVDARSGAFLVVDHTNASQTRPARTLSGGETFLASLALALALADHLGTTLAATGPARLDALFLDEGFGTLDPDTLDVVATALDELGARGRMVGVVTHVRELANRLPVRFEVRKVGGSATVERVEGVDT